MNKVIAENVQQLLDQEGTEIGPTEYVEITQKQINTFARATGDFQWIHVDEERAKRESPFKKTIAHGYLTVSMIPTLLFKILDVRNSQMTVNYGIEKLRFGEPVLVNDRIRLKAKLASVKQLRKITRVVVEGKIEIENKNKPAVEGSVVLLYYF
ncbi:MaoC family dehydratase [candidate division KSB1 bacterium]|nr:MaoC family dehydratase [candidate division KSB1 bacterium]